MRRFEELVFDINRQFSVVKNGESSWDIAQNITRDIGGTALNVAGTRQFGSEVAWAMSGMSNSWLEAYQYNQFYTVDPLLSGLIDGTTEMYVRSGSLTRNDVKSTGEYELNNQLKAHGYHSLFASSFGDGLNGEKTLIVHCSESSLEGIDQEIGFEKLRVIHGLLAANIRRPNKAGGPEFINLSHPSLTSRERDILQWLACGLRNDEIAHKAGIAEVTVRKHLMSVRSKLSAVTREQAVAIAMRDGLIHL